AVGDLNGDGWGDLVVANFMTNFVSVLLNNGDGTFQPAVKYVTANKPEAVAIGDFNGDGTNDIAATTSNSTNMISILLGNGNGTFQPAIRHGTFGMGGPIVLRDFNGDGKLDMICNSLLGLQVQLGNGNGTFQPVGGLVGVLAFGQGSVAIADFNGDHTNDMALATGSTNVSIYLGSTNGTWRPAVNKYLTGTNTQSVAVGDFDGDGTNDLAAANFGTPSAPDGTVSILRGNGNGTFRPPVHYYAGAHPMFVATADFNGDGKLDLVVRNLIGFGVHVLLGNGDGTFQPPFGFGGLNDSSFSAIAVGDMNADGKPDLALPNLGDSISVMLNICTSLAPELLFSWNSSS
ncbi:MAG TPA: VCBS repeat-containing protein, partial [Candidatus Binatia bacterium]|nr:VCBS repeat-containing protein [Candidatus Binatia bacterium]